MDRIATIKKQVQLEEWAEMVRSCRNSGMIVRRWCNENGVNQKTYYYRLRKVREIICEEQRDIVPVTCNIPVTASADIKIQSRQYEYINAMLNINNSSPRKLPFAKFFHFWHMVVYMDIYGIKLLFCTAIA